MSVIKNISANILFLNDIGTELVVGEVFDLASIPLIEINNSTDIPDSINAGLLVYVNSDGTTQTLTESQVTQQNNSSGVDLSNYLTIVEVQALIDAIPLGGSSVKDIIFMPSFLAYYNKIKFGDNSGSSNFYKQLPVPYYINKNITTLQTITNILGSGFLTGIMLPKLKISNGVDRRVEIKITVDGIVTREQFIFSDTNDARLRLFIGSASGEDGEESLVLINDKYNKNFLNSDRRPLKHGTTTHSVEINNPTINLMNNNLPKIEFKTQLLVEYTVNQIDVFDSNSYKNRAVAIYTLGDF